LRGETYRDADSVSISLATQRHATHRAAVMEIRLNSMGKKHQHRSMHGKQMMGCGGRKVENLTRQNNLDRIPNHYWYVV